MTKHGGLEPRLKPLLALAALDRSAGVGTPMVTRRTQSARRSERLGALGMLPGPDPATTWDELVPVDGGRIPVRLYRPDRPGTLPLYVFIHGGGWCAGTIDERDPRCRTIATEAGCLVASINYRLAPENQYPTAPEDCYSTLRWLGDNATRLRIDPRRIAIGGESAGANLAAAVCLMARDRSGPSICHQWLDVPATDATMSQSGFREVADGYLLDAAVIEDYLDHYLFDPAQVTEPYCSPLFAADHSELPPAWIIERGVRQASRRCCRLRGGT